MGITCKKCCDNCFNTDSNIDPVLFVQGFESNVPDFKEIMDDENKFNELIPKRIQKYMTENKFQIPENININTNVIEIKPIKFLDENIYQGTWNEKYSKDGKGKYYMKAEQKFIEGIWENNKLIYGRIFFSNNDIYEGYIKNFNFDGKGKMLYGKSGDNYEGEFSEGKRQGDGKYIFSDKTTYKGKFDNNKFKGKGKMNWPSMNRKYEGEFSDGCFNNQGKLVGNNGEQYEGNFKNSYYDGQGKYTFNDGSTYEGSFSLNLRHGNGIFIKKNNEFRFEGKWENDYAHGKGTFIIGDTTIKGEWRNGEFEGQLNNDFNKDILNFKIPLINLIPDRLPHMRSSLRNNIF